MNALLDPLKKIANDLVERKLWPIAVALLVAIVAVPMILGGGSNESAAPTAATAAAGQAAPGKSLVTVADTADAAPPQERDGKIEDPFYNPPDPPKEETAPSETTTTPADGAGNGGTPPSGAPSESVPTQPVEPVAAPTYYRTVVRWYENTKSKPRPLARLTPLGGLVDTAALYLGVTKSKSSGTYAVFLLGANATSDGEARCKDGTECRVIGLKSGQTQLVTVTPPDGGQAHQYVLDVISVRGVETSASEAREMRAKEHPDGRDVMREMWATPAIAQALGPIQYDRDSGLLVTTSSPAGAADASGAAAAKAAG